MNRSKLLEAGIVVGGVVLLILSFNLLLGVAVAVMGFLFTVVGALFKLLFSKSVLILAGIGLILYLLVNRGKTNEMFFGKS